MSYKIQDVMRFVIPGLYLIGAYAVIALLSGNFDDYLLESKKIEILKSFVAVIVLLLPFSGFIVGYFIECTMSFFERLIYFLGMPRPSWVLLFGHLQCLYTISSMSLTSIKKANKNIYDLKLSRCQYINNNRIAKKIYQLAKQNIDKTKVENYWVMSILARNIFGAQLFLAIFPPLLGDNLSCRVIVGNIIIAFVFFIFWGHNNCVYAKYTLAEYGKVLNQKDKNGDNKKITK